MTSGREEGLDIEDEDEKTPGLDFDLLWNRYRLSVLKAPGKEFNDRVFDGSICYRVQGCFILKAVGIEFNSLLLDQEQIPDPQEEDPERRSPKSRLQYSYGLGSRTLRWIYFLGYLYLYGSYS